MRNYQGKKNGIELFINEPTSGNWVQLYSYEEVFLRL